jgi:hypothetical protein
MLGGLPTPGKRRVDSLALAQSYRQARRDYVSDLLDATPYMTQATSFSNKAVVTQLDQLF